MKQILVKDEANIKIGELQFQDNKFFFVYDNNFVGFQFSDINVNLSRNFESESLFNIFAFDESWNKNELVKIHCLENKTENEIQWFILNLWAEKDELVQGFKYEKTSMRNWNEIYPQLCIFFSEVMEKYTK